MASPSFKFGMGLEDRIIAMLERSGFMTRHDRELDHDYKVDFVIQSFPDNLCFDSIGVQVTCYLNNSEKMKVFYETSRRWQKFRRCLYLEIHQGVDLERNVRRILEALLINYQFNRSIADDKVMGARIYADGTYRMFDLLERIQLLESQAASRALLNVQSPSTAVVSVRPAAIVPAAPEPAVTREYKAGVLTNYSPEKGFGFITSGGIDYFFHMNCVNDPDLRTELFNIPNWNVMADLQLNVLFIDMGVTKKDAIRSEARDVRLRS